jgi:septal ring factor EnvC (AmiA/AmiB activator)
VSEDDTQEGQDYPHRRRKGDSGIPEWAKLAATVAIATVSVILWANANFISRAEMNQHLDQQSKDFARVSSSQEHYADAERGTAENLSEINSRLTRIETMLETRSVVRPKQ